MQNSEAKTIRQTTFFLFKIFQQTFGQVPYLLVIQIAKKQFYLLWKGIMYSLITKLTIIGGHIWVKHKYEKIALVLGLKEPIPKIGLVYKLRKVIGHKEQILSDYFNENNINCYFLIF